MTENLEAEQKEIIRIFTAMLMHPTKDGGNKRAKGQKPNWKEDPGHIRAIFSHLGKWIDGELVDEDSKCHPLVNCAWRCLAQAYKESSLRWIAELEKTELRKGWDC